MPQLTLRKLQTSSLQDIGLITTPSDQKNATDDQKSTTWKQASPQINELSNETNETKQPSSPTPNDPPKKSNYEIRQLSDTLQLSDKERMLYVPLQFREYENFDLLDTGAIQSALSEAELRRILTALTGISLQELPAPEFKVQFANDNIVPIRKQVLLRFFIGGKIFEETFMVLPTMGNVLIGM